MQVKVVFFVFFEVIQSIWFNP